MSAGRGNAKRAITKAVPDMLLKDIRRLVEESRRAVAVTINAELSFLLLNVRSASSLMRKTITSTCSFSTASSNVSLPLN
jgi:hypothetical protein